MDDNIHTPTVPSGPASGGVHRDLSKLSMVDLMQEKARIEEELSALSGVLSSVSTGLKIYNPSSNLATFQQGVNMNSSLTTFDGFPRDDIDVAQGKRMSAHSTALIDHFLVRTTRVRIIHLRNDHKDVMNHLEKGLHSHFANLQRTQGAASTDNTSSQPPTLVEDSLSGAGMLGTPFAKVNSVVSGSPADQAGLKAGDTIRGFGTVNWINHERLSKVAEAVQQNEGVCTLFKSWQPANGMQRALSVKVTRDEDSGSTTELDLQLIPRRNWGGRGLLGCHLVPL